MRQQDSANIVDAGHQTKSTHKMLPRSDADRIQIAFDDHRLVANAGLILPSTLTLHLVLSQTCIGV